MNMRLIDWIWHIRGSVPLRPYLSPEDVFDNLDTVLNEPGTIYTRDQSALSFKKEKPASQDKMAVFNSGILQISDRSDGRFLVFDLNSYPLFFCFFAPLLFLGFAGMIESSRKPSMVFAALFLILYVAGRLLEQRQVKSLLCKTVSAPSGGMTHPVSQ